MALTKSDWYLILLAIVIFALIVTNELGIGVITFLPLTLLAHWLMIQTFGKGKPGL